MTVPPGLENPPELVELQNLQGFEGEQGEEEAKGGGIRFKAIRQEGMRVGAQAGLSSRYGMIVAYLEAVESKINVTFNFAGFVRDGRLLLPSVIETPNRFIKDESKREVTVVRNSYTVQDEAKIVSNVPTWRDYLWQSYSYPEMPHVSLLPRTDAERAAWKNAVSDGWRAGVSQADEIYFDRLARLTADTEGRYLYVTLENKKMFTPAALQVVANKVTFNGRTMNVGEIIYSISSDANYTNSGSWRPVWTRQ